MLPVTGPSRGAGGSIALAARPGSPEVLLATSMVEDVVTKDTDHVRIASVTFDRVRGDAASRAESRAMISEALQVWNSR